MFKHFHVICVCPGGVFKKYHLNVKQQNVERETKKLICAVQAKYANVYQDGKFVKRFYKY